MITDTIQAFTISMQSKLPTIIWGVPGNGKTSTIEAIARSLNLHLETVIASISEPSDLTGVVTVVDGKARHVAKAWAHNLCEAGKGILFFDELNTSVPSVQAALLRVILQGYVGELKLPDNVYKVAAANPPEMSAGGWDLTMPLSNRLIHLDWDLSLENWSIGMISGFDDFYVQQLPDTWEENVRLTRPVIVSFLKSNPTLLSQPPKDEFNAGRAWPSHRSWDFTSRLLAAAGSIGASNPVKFLLVKGAVGEGPAISFMTYLKNLDLPDPEEVLAHPDTFVMPDRADKKYVILNSVVSIVLSNLTAERWVSAWKILNRAFESEAPDIVIPCSKTLMNVCFDRKRNNKINFDLPEVTPIIKKFVPVIRKAGVLLL